MRNRLVNAEKAIIIPPDKGELKSLIEHVFIASPRGESLMLNPPPRALTYARTVGCNVRSAPYEEVLITFTDVNFPEN